jgi:hypothetical protein
MNKNTRQELLMEVNSLIVMAFNANGEGSKVVKVQ